MKQTTTHKTGTGSQQKKAKQQASGRQKEANRSRRHTAAADKWERQADDAAFRVLRGEQDVANRLTPANAALFSVPGSAGRPLPENVRNTLEESFGADLSAVRIHHDHYSNSAARQHWANAFTAGSHIFFRSGLYNPNAPSGCELLNHEIAHVLQQTGRPSSGGVVKAADIQGAGDIQREWNYSEFRMPYVIHAGLAPELEQYPTPNQVHVRESFNRIEAAIRTAVGLEALQRSFSLTTQQGSGEGAAALAAQVIHGDFDNEDTKAKSLLFDVLKIWRRNEAAAHLIDNDADIMTRYYPDDSFSDYIYSAEGYGNDAIRRLLESEHEDFHNIWPYNLTYAVWQFLIETRRLPSSTTPGYPQDYTAVWGEYEAHGETFIHNELYLWARNEMLRADTYRHNKIMEVLQQFIESDSEDIGKRYMASHLAQEFDQAETDETPFLRQARRGMRNIARAAQSYWDQVVSLREELQSAAARRAGLLLYARDGLENAPLPEYSFPQDSLLHELVSLVEQHVRSLFYRTEDGDGPTVLPQSEYSTAISNFQTALNPYEQSLSDRIGEIYVYGLREEAQLAARARWLGWALLWQASMRLNLEQYPASSDAAASNDDIRLRHRLLLAGDLYLLGLAADNRTIIDTAETVFAAEDVGHSYILLTNEWRNTNHGINQLTTDYTGSHAIRGWGLTVNQLVLLYHILYQSDTANQLMSAYQGAPGATEENPVHRAFADQQIEQYNAVLNHERIQRLFPKRYENSDAIINYYASDDSTLSDVIRRRTGEAGSAYRNREYARFVSDYAEGNARRILLPLGRPSHFVIWVLPPFQALYDVLKQVTLLNALVPADITDPADWMYALGEAIAGFSPERQREFNTQLRSVYDQMTSRAYGWRRRRYTELVRSKLIVAANNRRDIGHYADMGDALGLMRQFSFSIRPRDAIQPQMTAMTLDLADQLGNALLDRPSEFEAYLGIDTRVDTRYDVITGYYGMIDQALEFMGSARAREQIADVVVVNDQLQRGESPEQRTARVQREKEARTTALMDNQSVLQSIHEQLSAAIRRIQLEGIGFEGRRNGVKSFNYASTLPLQQEMYSGGKIYIIDAIFTDFNYFPPYGAETDAAHPSILRLVSGSDSEDASRERRTRLLRYTEDGREYLVTAHESDDHHLVKLARVIEDAAFVQSMENLAEVIEGAAELTLDLIELVPGFGQGVMVARMGVEISRFVIEELPNIIDSLDNPQEVFDQLTDWFGQEEWVENILEYLIFNADTFAFPAALSARGEDPNHGRRRRHSGLDRVIHAVRTLGEKIFYAFQLLQRTMRGGFARAQLSLIEYRTLMRILELLPGLALTSVTMLALARAWEQRVEERLEGTPLSPSELISAFLNSQVQEGGEEQEGRTGSGGAGNIQQQIQAVFAQIAEGLHSVELPENVVPMDSLVDVLIGYVLDRFGRKGRILNDFLDAVGARAGMASEIEEHLVRGTNIDINVHWRTHLREPLQAKLVELQNFIINDGMNPLIRETMGSQYLINVSALGQPEITTHSEPAETQPYQKDGHRHGDTFVQWPGSASGNALSSQQRKSLESEFGHNLGHVRLHTDDRAHRFTDSADAHALTSGSHIYLSTDTNINSPQGKHILRHEVAHVLQQTGERPLGEAHNEKPVSGRRGVGVRHDRSKEQAAERMANRAGRGEGVVPVEETGGTGFYPAARGFVLRMLNYLSDSQVAEQVADDLEDRIPRMSAEERQSFNTAKSEARALWRAVNQEVGAGQQRDFDAPFHPGRSMISAALGTLYDGAAQAIDALTYRSVRQRSNGHYQLRVDRFLSRLRTYIYGKSGIVLSISTAGDQVSRVRVTYIHLGNTPTNYSIWTDRSHGVKHNTEAAATSEQRAVLHRNWGRIKDRIRSLNYETRNVWHGSEFRLSDALIRELAEHFREAADDEVAVGNWEQYTTPTLSGSERRVGLRVATHGQLTATRRDSTPLPPAPAGVANPRGENIHQAAKTGRESHHIPQYLLVEYFRNQASTKLFPAGEPLMPGFEGSRDALDSFNGGSGQQIDLAALDPGGRSNRGLNLPAVSIAAITHQRGQLHVNQASEWSQALELDASNTGTLTQSLWLDYFFYQQVETNSRRHVTGARATSDKSVIISRVRGMPEAQAKTAVFSAMQESYQTMYANMMAMFEPALVRYEIPYYRDIVMANVSGASTGRLPRGYEPSSTRLGTVKTALADLNTRIMHQWR